MVKQACKSLLLMMVVIGCGHDDTSHLQNVRFRIVEEGTCSPLINRELNICRFVYFKLKPGAPSPYLSKEGSWYITSITTDENGIFLLDLSSIKAMDIVVEPGKPYNIVRFERSSNLAHTKSADHIRIVRFELGTTRVASNVIYDLKRRVVKTFPISGKPVEEPFTEIELVVKTGEEFSSVGYELEPEFSKKAKEMVPILPERLSSEDPLVALELIDELVAVETDREAIQWPLRYDLSSSGYSLLLRRAVPRLIEALSTAESAASLLEQFNAGRTEKWTIRRLKSRLLSTIDVIAEFHELEGVAPVLAPLLEDEDPAIVKEVAKILVRFRSVLAAEKKIPLKSGYGCVGGVEHSHAAGLQLED